MKRFAITALLALIVATCPAQTVELYGGDQRAGVDLLWFKYFKYEQKNTPWLYFSRNRISVDYENKPAWASVNAVSYNHKSGLGLVAVGTFLQNGLVPKAGIQYVKISRHFLFFGWVVSDLKQDPGIDLFGLFRYMPSLSPKWDLFTQFETSNTFPTPVNEPYSFVQRLRLGLKRDVWQFGFMGDFAQYGRDAYEHTRNTGVFLRHEF